MQLTWNIWVDFWRSEGTTLLGLNNTNKEGYKLWTTVTSTESIYDSTRIDNSDVNSEGNLLGIYDDAKLGLSDNKMIGVSEFFKICRRPWF